MIDFKKTGDEYVLLIGYDYFAKSPKRIIPVTKEEAEQFASNFTEDFAIAIGNKEKQWSYGAFKLTDAPEHPYGWTDVRKRTLLFHNELSWHMIAPEIAEIGSIAKRVLESDE
jgi:hypothetical protein